MAHLLSDNEGRNGTVYIPIYTKPDFGQPVHISMAAHVSHRGRWTRSEVIGMTFACVWIGFLLVALALGIRDIAIALFRLVTGGHA